MWQEVGVPENSVVVTGSVKFDLEHIAAPKVRADFQHMLDAFGAGRPVVVAASTHAQLAAHVQDRGACALGVEHPGPVEHRAVGLGVRLLGDGHPCHQQRAEGQGQGRCDSSPHHTPP